MKNRLERKVKGKIEDKMGVSAMHIKVRKVKGDVELSGFVDLLADRRDAENIASDIPGVKNVRNNITISTDGTITDSDLEKEVNRKLRNSLYHNRLRGVSGDVSGGTAVLEGAVETQRERKLALQEASKAAGIKDVVNHIKVSSYSDDITIANEINRTYLMSYIDIQDVSTIIEDGIVKLYGFVNNKAEASHLVSMAEEVEGVNKVMSFLEIRDWSLD